MLGETRTAVASARPDRNSPGAETHSVLLSGLVGRDLEAVLSEARVQNFTRHTVVTRQDAAADRLFLLTRGRARFFYETPEGSKLVLLWLTPGDIFGGVALVERQLPYLVGTEALKDSSALVWDRVTLRKLVLRYPRLLQNALLFAHQYLAWYLADHCALVTTSARQRLARVIVCLAENIGQKIGDQFEIDATNEELASAANITTFTASRILSEWQERGTIEKRRGKIVVLSKERLSAFKNKENKARRSAALGDQR
jgi:CRP/FNR family transcriptional regulator, nitrogen oxide reductase regulator